MWLLSVALAFGLILGPSAEARAFAELDAEATVAGLDDPPSDGGNQTTSAAACHPGIACAAFVVPAGPSPALAGPYDSRLRPEVAQSQRRFGGPTVTLPPPRHPV